MSDNDKIRFMELVIDMAAKNVEKGKGGPFAAIVVKGGRIIGKGTNLVTSINDPTAHAEIIAIREACKNLNSFHLHGCEIYTSCEPCPMCLGAIYWARIEKVYYAGTREDAMSAGFDDSKFYEEICKSPAERTIKMEQMLQQDVRQAFDRWINKKDKIPY
jgi:tRNA(Arg) A34 adenosine deaminase TadA